MQGPKEVQAVAMVCIQDFLNKLTSESPEHAANMLLTMISATTHILAGVTSHEHAAQACEHVAAYMRTNPTLPRVEQSYGETEKVPTVAGNNTIN